MADQVWSYGTELTIDEEFEQWLEQVPEESDEALEASVSEHGIRDSVVTWQGTIIDGHRRYRTARKLGISFPVRELDLPDRLAVLKWMDREQSARRNTTTANHRRRLARLVELEKQHGRGANKRVAEAEKVSERTVERANRYERLKSGLDEGVRYAWDSLRVQASLQALAIFAGLDTDLQHQVLEHYEEDGADKLSVSLEAVVGEEDDGGPAPEDTQEPEPKPVPEPAIVRDENDRVVPSHLKAAHQLTAQIASAASRLTQVSSTVGKLANEPGGEFLPVPRITEEIAKLRSLINHSRYWSQCPQCGNGPVNPDCKKCDGAGFLPYSRRQTLSREEQEWLDDSSKPV